jgi:hypothetical protein
MLWLLSTLELKEIAAALLTLFVLAVRYAILHILQSRGFCSGTTSYKGTPSAPAPSPLDLSVRRLRERVECSSASGLRPSTAISH